MAKALVIAKYHFRDHRNSLLIFYGILLGLAAMGLATAQNGTVSMGGFEFSSVIFIFIVGLNSFKKTFRFTQANNVSRRTFYIGTILGLLLLAALMTLLNVVLDLGISSFLRYESFYRQLYEGSRIAEFLWTFSLFTLGAYGGWFINMLYYRSNKLMKTVISISPFIAFILLIYFDQRSNHALGSAILRFLNKVLGFADLNSYYAVLSFVLAGVAVLGLNYLLVHRAPIKN